MFRAANDIIQLGKKLALLANQQPGIGYDVDKQDVSDLEPKRINLSLLHFLKEVAHKRFRSAAKYSNHRTLQNAESTCSLSITVGVHNADMPAIFDRVLVLNLIANTAIFYLAARLYLLPQLSRLRPRQILIPILLLHSTRHLGMMFLARGATYPGLPLQFAYPAAFGDLLTAVLALIAIPCVLRGSHFARTAVWVFNIFGTIDLVVAITLATIYNAPVAMGPAYWIPAFWVPLLLVTHYVTFVLLRRGGKF